MNEAITSHETNPFSQETAVLAGLTLNSAPVAVDEAERSLAELAELARAAGARVAASLLQRRQAPDPATLIGRGKVEELRQACEALEASLIIFDEELSGSQIRNLERLTGRKVIDRTLLILDIFADRAQSREGRLQVELAQLQVRLSRLAGMGQALSRLGGGIGTRGPGESQLESDRRHIGRRIGYLKRALAEISAHRERTRRQRQSGDLLTLAVVGYTNAGKSTLINRLCAASLLTADQVFATLDPAVRRLSLPDQAEILLIDTVGFIRKLPHELVDAFHSTPEEVTDADAILQVIDAADPDAAAQMAVAEELLTRLEAAGKPRLLVFNKIDSLTSGPDTADPDRDDAEPSGLVPELAAALQTARHQPAFLISARTGEGLDALLQAIAELAAQGQIRTSLLLPYSETGLVEHMRKYGRIDSLVYTEEGIELAGRIKCSYFSPLRPFVRLAEKSEKK